MPVTDEDDPRGPDVKSQHARGIRNPPKQSPSKEQRERCSPSGPSHLEVRSERSLMR